MLFYSISGMLPLRTLSYPKVLSYLKRLALDHSLILKDIYNLFLRNEIENAYSRKDVFALMWLAYMVADSDEEDLKTLATSKLALMRRRNKIIKDMVDYVNDPGKEIKLWEQNRSQIILSRNEYLSAVELYDYLGISFAES